MTWQMTDVCKVLWVFHVDASLAKISSQEITAASVGMTLDLTATTAISRRSG